MSSYSATAPFQGRMTSQPRPSSGHNTTHRTPLGDISVNSNKRPRPLNDDNTKAPKKARQASQATDVFAAQAQIQHTQQQRSRPQPGPQPQLLPYEHQAWNCYASLDDLAHGFPCMSSVSQGPPALQEVTSVPGLVDDYPQPSATPAGLAAANISRPAATPSLLQHDLQYINSQSYRPATSPPPQTACLPWPGPPLPSSPAPQQALAGSSAQQPRGKTKTGQTTRSRQKTPSQPRPVTKKSSQQPDMTKKSSQQPDTTKTSDTDPGILRTEDHTKYVEKCVAENLVPDLSRVFFGGCALRQAGIELPKDLAPEEWDKRARNIVAVIYHYLKNPPVPPPSEVLQRDVEIEPPVTKPAKKENMTPAEKVAFDKAKTDAEEADKKRKQKNNNDAAKKSRDLKDEKISDTGILLSAMVAQCLWLSLKLVAQGGALPNETWGGIKFAYKPERWVQAGLEEQNEESTVPERVKEAIAKHFAAVVAKHHQEEQAASRARTAAERASMRPSQEAIEEAQHGWQREVEKQKWIEEWYLQQGSNTEIHDFVP